MLSPLPVKRALPLDAIGVGLVLGVGVAIAASAWADRAAPPPADAPPAAAEAPAPSAPAAPTTADPLRRTSTVEAVEKATPAVVAIETQAAPSPWRSGGAGQGSGVIIDADGTLLTNAHVVDGAAVVTATLADGQRFEADIVGIAPELDLAVLRVRSRGVALSPIARATSADLMLGEPVIAIGNPFGLGHTVTTGVISATSRPLETDTRVYQDFIQTDASINPGNSGGPLLNAHGALIGINTAIRQGAEGIGFAIPADRALKVAQDLQTFGAVQIPWLGVALEDVVWRAPEGRRVAPRVTHVWAEDTGIPVGALLVSIDGRAIQSRADLNAHLAAIDPARPVQLGVLTAAGTRTFPLTTRPVPPAAVDALLAGRLGATVSAAPAGTRIASLRRDGALARAGLRPGDDILAVNQLRTESPDALRAALRQALSTHRPDAVFTLRRGEDVGRLSVPL